MDFNTLLLQLWTSAVFAATSMFFWISIAIALLVGYGIAIGISRATLARTTPSKAARTGLGWGFFVSYLLVTSFLSFFWWGDFVLIGTIIVLSLLIVFLLPWIFVGLLGHRSTDLEA